MYVCMYVRTYVRTYVRMYVCMYMYVCICMYVDVSKRNNYWLMALQPTPKSVSRTTGLKGSANHPRFTFVAKAWGACATEDISHICKSFNNKSQYPLKHSPNISINNFHKLYSPPTNANGVSSIHGRYGYVSELAATPIKKKLTLRHTAISIAPKSDLTILRMHSCSSN